MAEDPTPPTVEAEFDHLLTKWRQPGQEPRKELTDVLRLVAQAEVDRWFEAHAPEKPPFKHFILPPPNYNAYLRGKKWRTIRERILARDGNECCICPPPMSAPATEVHHRSYHPLVLKGVADEQLISLCRACHRYVEFVDGTGEARRRTEMYQAEARIEERLALRRAFAGAAHGPQ
ncbi:MAG: HNH endonuclease signature motif containing protein [Rhodospirillales bacterium]